MQQSMTMGAQKSNPVTQIVTKPVKKPDPVKRPVDSWLFEEDLDHQSKVNKIKGLKDQRGMPQSDPTKALEEVFSTIYE